jgi:hypothetical protein
VAHVSRLMGYPRRSIALDFVLDAAFLDLKIWILSVALLLPHALCILVHYSVRVLYLLSLALISHQQTTIVLGLSSRLGKTDH